jgi:hypothetical protein
MRYGQQDTEHACGQNVIMYRFNSDEICIRSAPTIDAADILGEMQNGEVVECLEELPDPASRPWYPQILGATAKGVESADWIRHARGWSYRFDESEFCRTSNGYSAWTDARIDKVPLTVPSGTRLKKTSRALVGDLVAPCLCSDVLCPRLDWLSRRWYSNGSRCTNTRRG